MSTDEKRKQLLGHLFELHTGSSNMSHFDYFTHAKPVLFHYFAHSDAVKVLDPLFGLTKNECEELKLE